MRSHLFTAFARFASLLPMAAIALLLLGCTPNNAAPDDMARDTTSEAQDDHDEHASEPDAHGDDKDDHEEDGHGHGEEEDGHGHEEGGEGHGEEEQVVRLSDAEIKEFGIEIQVAGPGRIDQYIELPGEIVLNADRLAHVPPRLSGIVREVFKSLGDYVETGETLAVIESRDLADAKSEFLAARARLALAQASLEREEMLWKKKISAEKDYLEAKRALTEAEIAIKSAEQKLHALGFSDLVKKLKDHPDPSFTYFEIRAPFSGTIIEKHITLGETLEMDTAAFTIADLSTVWVDINVYQKDLAEVRQGQTAVIEIGHGFPSVSGKIIWVGPLVGEMTRTAKARMILPNPKGELRPGQFVTAKVAVASIPVEVRVPKNALQTIDGRTLIFVQTDEGFEPRPVETKRTSHDYVEIVSGLLPGQAYVSRGAFTLKAQLSKGAFVDGHSH